MQNERLSSWQPLFFGIQIDEAVGRLSDAFCDDHPDVDWWAIYGLRCYVVHGYENANREILWEAATDDLLRLQQRRLDLLKGLEPQLVTGRISPYSEWVLQYHSRIG